MGTEDRRLRRWSWIEAVRKSAGDPQIFRFVAPAQPEPRGFSHVPRAPAFAGATIGKGADLIVRACAGVTSTPSMFSDSFLDMLV